MGPARRGVLMDALSGLFGVLLATLLAILFGTELAAGGRLGRRCSLGTEAADCVRGGAGALFLGLVGLGWLLLAHPWPQDDFRNSVEFGLFIMLLFGLIEAAAIVYTAKAVRRFWKRR
jgi:hypothetical protein